VHRVRVYDHHIGTVVVSRRMATEEGAKVMGGQIIPDTAVENRCRSARNRRTVDEARFRSRPGLTPPVAVLG
jgi:hypothetical protein